MERRLLSIGFVDLTHYAKLMDAVGDERTLEVLQERFQLAGDAILNHGGLIRKYIGDCILFTFDDPRQAVSTAREIAAIPARVVDGLEVRFRVSVATGEVLLTRIGHPAYLVEDLIGQPVNRAARGLGDAGRSESGVWLCEETRKYA